MGRKEDLIAFCLSFLILMIGGAIYYGIENPNEVSEAEAFLDLESEFREVVQDVSQKYNQSFDDLWFTLTNYSDAAASATDPDNPNWGMPGSAFFCFTIMTTIGYGTFSPSTDGGKCFAIFYVLLSVPSFLFALACVSNNLVELGTYLEARYMKYKPMEEMTEEEIQAKEKKSFRNAMIGLPAFMVFFMLFFAIGFSYAYGWTYLTSFYYNVVTLTTVGLGDYAPTPTDSPAGMVTFGFYAVIGLATLACFIENIQNAITSAAKNATHQQKKLSKYEDQKWKDNQQKAGWEISHLQHLHNFNERPLSVRSVQ